MSLQEQATSQLISIIMPAYNAGRYIAEAIQSVQNQSYPHWELLIIDDASTDNTGEVVSAFLTDSRVRYQKVAKRIGHPSGGRNLGIQNAQGVFIAFLDADDLYEPDALTNFVEHMDHNSDCTAVYGFYQKITETGELILDKTPFLELGNDGQTQVKAGYEHTWKNILTSQTIHQMCFMARASLFKEIGLFNETITVGEDFSLYIRMFLHRFDGVQFVPRYVYQYRQYSESICNNSDRFDEILHNQAIFFKHIFSELPLPQEALAYRSELIGSIYGYYARTRYNQKKAEQLRSCLKVSWEHPDLKKSDWLKYCAPFAVRSSLGSLDGILTRFYWLIKSVGKLRVEHGQTRNVQRGVQS